MVIAGPTASGKSALALALSRLIPATIINADASQLYRDLRIVTARPSDEEEAQAPHRLFGVIDGAEAMTAADWADQVKAAIEEAHNHNHVPILVGGTGLYLRTLLEGIAPVPPIDPAVRETVRSLAPELARNRLAALDPERAAQLGRNDRARIARSLEVVMSTGRTLAHWQGERVGGIADHIAVTGVVLLPPREWLRARCDARFDAMIANGGVAEVQTLLARGLPASAPIMKAIGVREIADMLRDPDTRIDRIAEAKAATRQYAKRQYTWFRNQLPASWICIDAQLDTNGIEEFVIKLRDMVLTS